jgi:hypothetical protein
MLFSEPLVVGKENNLFSRVPSDAPERVSAGYQTFPRSRRLVDDQSSALVQVLIRVTDISLERGFDQFCVRVACMEYVDEKVKEGVA